jgi:hypothetical protein
MSNICSGKPWGYIAPSVPNAPKCISICRQSFLETLLSFTNNPSDDDETFAWACETLSDNNQVVYKDHPFWRLYCCDAQRCGVDNVERLGEDRTSALLLPPTLSFGCVLVNYGIGVDFTHGVADTV